MSNAMVFLMLGKAGLRQRLLNRPVKMLESAATRAEQESKEESILAMLGIIGTVLNLMVIVFVYIYTTL